MKAQFPADWLVERTGKSLHWRFTEPSELKHIFKTIRDAKEFLDTGELPKTPAERAAQVANEAKAVELRANFPSTWTIWVPRKGSFRLQEPMGIYIFKSLKDAKAFLDTGLITDRKRTSRGPNAMRNDGDDNTGEPALPLVHTAH